VGADLDELSGGQLGMLGVRCEGLLVRDQHTLRNQLVYLAKRRADRDPRGGVRHFEKLQITPMRFPRSCCRRSELMYFRDLAENFCGASSVTRAVGDHALGVAIGWMGRADWARIRARWEHRHFFAHLTEARELLESF